MIKKNKKISIIILNYNGKKLLKKFLPSVVKHSDPKLSRVYVVDNNSTDGSIQLLNDKFHSVTIISHKKNYGYAGGYNKCISKISSNYYIFLNNDVEVTDNWLKPMLDAFEANSNMGACQPKILSYNDKKYFEYAGAAGGYIDFLGYPYCRGRIFDSLEKDEGQYNNKIKTFWSSGTCLMVRSKIFKNSGGFDEDFFAHMEEIDLCWRISKMGYDNFCIPSSKIYHLGGGTLNNQNPKKTYLNFRNNLIMLAKNEKLISLIYKIPLRLFLDFFASIKFLVDKKSFKHFFAIYKAYLYFIILLPKILFRRKNNIKKINLSSKIIAIEYFLKGNKRFSDL